MATLKVKTKDGQNRINELKHKGVPILSCDFSGCSYDEGQALLNELVATLQSAPDSSVRVFFDVQNTTHDSSQTNQWKLHLELFNQKLKKVAITGLSPMNRIALAGIRMYGKLMGQDKAVLLTQVFDNRDLALDYLATEK